MCLPKWICCVLDCCIQLMLKHSCYAFAMWLQLIPILQNLWHIKHPKYLQHLEKVEVLSHTLYKDFEAVEGPWKYMIDDWNYYLARLKKREMTHLEMFERGMRDYLLVTSKTK